MNTKFSKNFFILVIIIILVGGFLYFHINNKSQDISFTNNDIPVEITDQAEHVTKIGEQITIDEENISGSYPEIIGDSTIAALARAQIERFITETTDQANEQLPELRVEFPESFNDRKYESQVQGNYFSSDDSQSLVLLEYTYTGGANGNSFYVTFNQNQEGKEITLVDIVPAKKRGAFVELVQERLRNYHGGDGQSIELFDDAVTGISFEQLTRFAIDGNDLHIYFDKYEVGAGASGAVIISIDNYASIVKGLSDTDANSPRFSWSYEEVPNKDYPKSIVSLVVDDGSEIPPRYIIETIDGGCNPVDEDGYAGDDNTATMAKNSNYIMCYFAGFGRIFRVIDAQENYLVQGKNIEEGSPDYVPAVASFETIVSIPKK